jgi:hypothetical protein
MPLLFTDEMVQAWMSPDLSEKEIQKLAKYHTTDTLIAKPLFKEVTKQLKLQLLSDMKIYTLETTENFGNIVSRINVGDKVTVFM